MTAVISPKRKLPRKFLDKIDCRVFDALIGTFDSSFENAEIEIISICLIADG